MQLVKFMTSGMGRGVRVILGLAIISLGVLVVRGALGTIMALVGLIPLSGGVFDFCLIGSAMGYPLNGAAARKKLAGK
jgi:hypothetical protein